jgi:RHS repeat-associated protein
VFILADDQWREIHPRPHRTCIDYHFDDGHTTLWGTLRLNKHKTVATIKLQQGQPYRATYQAMTGHPQTQAAVPSGLYYLHTDPLNTPKVITDENQQIVWQADYMPFGQIKITTDIIDNPLRFPGQYYDAESELHYNWHRYYDPSTGRYITSDPIGLQGGLNTYAYVMSNPLRWVDSLGLYIPQNTANCRVVILADHTFFTGVVHDQLGAISSYSVTIPVPMNTPWSSAPDITADYQITYNSQDYIHLGLYQRNLNYQYVCENTDECGNTSTDSTFGYDIRKWWEQIDSGTFRWFTSDTIVNNPYPISDPYNEGPGALPPLSMPVPVIP